MNCELVIFDMDGTLVQSEDCSSQALLDIIPSLSANNVSLSELTARYRGARLANIFSDVESQFPGSVLEDCLDRFRQREEFHSHRMITASPGADEMLSRLGKRKCIASNAPREKTCRSLDICALSDHFPDGIFSANDLQIWKPDPALFLHCARHFGVLPEQCLVVEDSEVGIQAANAAGMPVVKYDPFKQSNNAGDTLSISSLLELLDLLN